MRVKQCLFCHKDFNAAKKITKYCCRSCQATHLFSIYGKESSLKRRTGKTLKCEHCQSDYYVPKHRLETAKYCSRSCLGHAHPERAEKARNNSPIMLRAGLSEPRRYKTIRINGKFVREHRYLMEQHLGRKLDRNEQVHHINGDCRDNRIENLQVLTNSEHQKLELSFFSSLLLKQKLKQSQPLGED